MKPTVYIETTIPSYYCDVRSELELHITRTRQWWDHERHAYDCYVSTAVMAELMNGSYPTKECCLRVVNEFPQLQLTQEIIEIAELYCEQQLMPRAGSRDALHLAFASVYRIDFLLTWNCRHLANANKFPRFQAFNHRLNLWTPQLVTPMNLQPFER